MTAEIVDGGEAGKSSHRKQWTKVSKWMHDRKRAGQAAAVLHKSLKKNTKRRTKTLKSILALDNVIRQTTTKGLEQFLVPFGEEGLDLTDPFDWRRLNLATDKGADKVGQDPFLAYCKLLNLHTDFDISHGSNCDQKGTLKATCLWQHCLLFASALNSVHGSALSPPRLHQLRENSLDYLDNVDLRLCPQFNSALPDIIQQLGLCVDVSDDNVVQEPGRVDLYGRFRLPFYRFVVRF